jgi:hypothetical protein
LPESVDRLRRIRPIFAWLKNREVGEAIGGFFFGAEKNLFRGNELLLPKNWDDLAAEGGISETEPAPSFGGGAPRLGAPTTSPSALDSLLEGDGFELPVPREIGSVSTLGEK